MKSKRSGIVRDGPYRGAGEERLLEKPVRGSRWQQREWLICLSLFQSSVLHLETILPGFEFGKVILQARSATEKRRWTSVRSYLCGEELEFDSVIAEEDSASVKSSVATVTQPITGDLNAEQSLKDAGSMEETVPQQQRNNSMSKLFDEEDAAVIIQSAFREYLVSPPFSWFNSNLIYCWDASRFPKTDLSGSNCRLEDWMKQRGWPMQKEVISLP